VSYHSSHSLGLAGAELELVWNASCFQLQVDFSLAVTNLFVEFVSSISSASSDVLSKKFAISVCVATTVVSIVILLLASSVNQVPTISVTSTEISLFASISIPSQAVYVVPPHHHTSFHCVQSYTFNTSLAVSYQIYHSQGCVGAVLPAYTNLFSMFSQST
jgi:hypothetical protein